MDDLLAKLKSGSVPDEGETVRIFEAFLDPETEAISDEGIACYLQASSQRLPHAAELIGAARSLRKHMSRVEVNADELIDTCGTGGSGLASFNASTASAIIAASAGLKVAKHGNRSISSRCGSADILEALGVSISHSPASAARALEELGFAFLFAPLFHPATRRVQLIRRGLGLRTIFNFLGPLCNPAGVRSQVLGVSDRNMLRIVAEALVSLGADHVLVLCGDDGLDEATLAGETQVAEVRGSEVREYRVSPESFGLTRRPLEEFGGAEPVEAAGMMKKLFDGKKDARRDFVLLNAGAALYIGAKTKSWKDGVELASDLLASGKPAEKLEQLTQGNMS